MPRLLRFLLVTILLTTSLVIPAAPQAHSSAHTLRQTEPVVIDFDDLTTTTWGTGGQTVVADQYAARGVTFNDPLVIDYATGTSGTDNFTHSGANALQHCYSREQDCATPLVITFTESQGRVGVWVGAYGNPDEIAEVKLAAFDAPLGGQEIESAYATLGPSDEQRIPVQMLLEVTSTSNLIKRVEVGYFPASARNERLVFDNLEFEVLPAPSGDALCPEDTGAPRIVLDQFGTLEPTQSNAVTLSGSTQSSAPLNEVTVTAAGPAGVRAKDLSTDLPTANGSFALSVEDILLPETNTVSVTVRNCVGEDSAEFIVDYKPIDEGVSYELLDVEVTQGIQDLTNGVPLIAGKRTFVRIYLRTTSEAVTLDNVSAQLPMCLDPAGEDPAGEDPSCLSEDAVFQSITSFAGEAPMGSVLAGTFLERTVIDSGTDIHAKRRSLATSVNFEVPPELFKPGQLYLALNDLTLSPDLPCDTCDSFTPGGKPMAVTFIKAPPLLLNIVNVTYNTADGEPHIADTMHWGYLESWLMRAFPINEIIRQSDLIDVHFEQIDGSVACRDMINQLFTNAIASASQAGNLVRDPRTRYVALYSTNGETFAGCAESHFAMGPTGSGDPHGWDNDGSYADFYAGHEVAHTFGRFHPGKCPGNSAEDTTAPTRADGLIAEGSNMYFGFDAGDGALGGTLEVPKSYRADNWYDLMTYCPNRWISSYTYRGILAQNQLENPEVVEGPPAEEPVVTAAAVAEAAPPGAGVLLVSGTVNLDNPAVELEPFLVLPGSEVTPLPATSDYSIVLIDDQNVETAYPFEPRLYTDQPPGVDRLAHLGEVVPWADNIETISIRRLGQELDARDVSDNPPDVEVTYPNGGEQLHGATSTVTWDASDVDPESVELTYNLLYSTDNGATWLSVAGGLQDQQYTVDLARLPGSATALYRVIATDGVNTGQDDSDAPFTVPNNAPTAGIVSPVDGSSFGSSHTIVLVGRASDVEQGNLGSAALQWSSNIDGPLGEGASISATNLTPGVHTITFTATDDQDVATSESIQVEISDDHLPVVTWDPATDTSFSPDGQLYYSDANRRAEFYATDGAGNIQLLNTFFTFLDGWSAIVPGAFSGEDALTDLFLYADETGLGEFYTSDGEGGLQLLSSSREIPDPATGWERVIPGDFDDDDAWTDLFFYDLDENMGMFYRSDGEGQLQPLGVPQSFEREREWTIIVPGNFGGDAHTDLLFYEGETGRARFYTADGEGRLVFLREDDDWTRNWNQIVPGNFDGQDDWTDLFFHHGRTKEVKFYATDGQGKITLLGIPDRFVTNWTTMIGGDFSGDDTVTDLFLYDRDGGRRVFLTTDGSGGLAEFGRSDASKGWNLIVPGRFSGAALAPEETEPPEPAAATPTP